MDPRRPLRRRQGALLGGMGRRGGVLMWTDTLLPCEAEAQDDPRFQYAEPTFAPPAGTWAPDCGHDACLADDKSCTSGNGWHDYDCPVAQCRWDTARLLCDFVKGHAGDHSYALRQVPVIWPKATCATWDAIVAEAS